MEAIPFIIARFWEPVKLSDVCDKALQLWRKDGKIFPSHSWKECIRMKFRKIYLTVSMLLMLSFTACAGKTDAQSAGPVRSGDSGEEEQVLVEQFMTGMGTYVPGEYQAVAKGHEEGVAVSIRVDANGILEVIIDASMETPEIGQAAVKTLQEQIWEAQGSEIEGVSGATETTNGVIEALIDCMEQAMR